MSPVGIEAKLAEGQAYASPFVGPTPFTVPLRVDFSGLTTDEVDSEGYLKPGVLLKRDGTLANATAGEFIYGAVHEAVKIADDNSDLAGITADFDVALVPIGVINRDALEDILGRALTADELAALDAAGSRLVITNT